MIISFETVINLPIPSTTVAVTVYLPFALKKTIPPVLSRLPSNTLSTSITLPSFVIVHFTALLPRFFVFNSIATSLSVYEVSSIFNATSTTG